MRRNWIPWIILLGILVVGARYGIQVVRVTDTFGDNVTAPKGYLSDDSYAAQVARGNITGAHQVAAYGESTASGALADQPLWPTGAGSSMPVPDAAGVQMSIVSSSASDDYTPAGTGAQTIHLHYLDGSLDEQFEEIQLDGTTPVLSTATDIRWAECTHINTYGSGGEAAGNISISNGGITYSYIEAGRKRCSSSFRRVPAGKRLMVKAMHAGVVSGTASAKAVVRLVMTKIDDVDYTEDALFIPVMSSAFQDTSTTLSLDMPFAVEAGTIIGMEYDVDKAATVTGGFVGYYENVD